jgi:hypothetical protein
MFFYFFRHVHSNTGNRLIVTLFFTCLLLLNFGFSSLLSQAPIRIKVRVQDTTQTPSVPRTDQKIFSNGPSPEGLTIFMVVNQLRMVHGPISKDCHHFQTVGMVANQSFGFASFASG